MASEWKLDFEDIILGDRIGKGNFGEVPTCLRSPPQPTKNKIK